jgi:hypothetical protein
MTGIIYIIFPFCRSNCHPEVLAIMREYYSIPHFLPEDAEHAHMDYVFIGYQQGAVMHVSNIHRLVFESYVRFSSNNRKYVLGHHRQRVVHYPAFYFLTLVIFI